MVDLENKQPDPAAVAKFIGDQGSAWVFFGSNQKKLLPAFRALGDHVTLIPISRPGANSLDFHLVFYLGYLAARHPKARFFVLSGDKGYDPAIAHAKTLAFEVKRLDKLPGAPKVAAKRAPIAKVSAKAGEPADKPSKPEVTAASKPVVSPAKQSKVPATKAAAPAKGPGKATVTKVATKNADAKPSKKTPVGVQKPASSSQVAPAVVSISRMAGPTKASAKSVDEVVDSVLKDMRGKNFPRSLKALERYVQTKFGPVPMPGQVKKVVDRLASAGVVGFLPVPG